MKLLSIIFLCAILSACYGYRILGVFPFHGKSHFMMFERLMKILAKKGHQVDVISTFPLKKPYPNYTDLVVLPVSSSWINNLTFHEIQNMFSVSATFVVGHMAGNMICEFLKHPKIQELIHNPPKNPPYDAIILEIFGAHCFGIIADILKVPMIGVSSSVLYPWSYDYIACPHNLAYVPHNLLFYTQNMNFWQRMYNFLDNLYLIWTFNKVTVKQTEIMRKYVKPDAPDIRDVERNMSIILVNSHISTNGIKNLNPALIEVGGLHVHDDETILLPPSLEKWMNESEHGFIYFSFGSMVMIESFPIETLQIFYNSMRKIAPVRVLMKIAKSDKLPPGLPENVYILPWIPQVKVLKHPNIKAFITHGGLMGSQEAIHYGVPMIGIPLFADQFININNYVRLNIAIKLKLISLTQEEMDHALNEILNNPKYKKAIKELSKKFLDRPMSSADTAIYWIEYIIKYGSTVLRSPAMDLTWWQIELLDVCGFLLIAALVVLYFLTLGLQFIYRLVNSNFIVPQKKKIS
ncbi:UDP-glucosyltransferase 2-like [Apis cerana]|nr:UDP-glucosyltransferase 2-like [Apis cerana]XP_061937715.1 UDP-glucosyltransferase 2-like [Apis cerana]XP_061937716.1 UDP-glucosyltransferase 2-like [Apis cerana]